MKYKYILGSCPVHFNWIVFVQIQLPQLKWAADWDGSVRELTIELGSWTGWMYWRVYYLLALWSTEIYLNRSRWENWSGWLRRSEESSVLSRLAMYAVTFFERSKQGVVKCCKVLHPWWNMLHVIRTQLFSSVGTYY